MGVLASANHHPRIYVACLAAYNNGHLHGAWIDAAQEPWTIFDAVQVLLRASPVAGAEEWAIHDHEGFGEVRIAECADLERVSELATFIAEHGEIGSALLDYFGGDVTEAQETMENCYLGAHASVADYVQEITEDSTEIPSALRYYVDWAAMALDAELNGDLFSTSTAWHVTHVFAGG